MIEVFRYRRRAAPGALALIAALLVSPIASAQEVAAPDGGTLPLWEVTYGERQLYLLGSIHLLRPEVYPLDPAIYAAFDGARVVAFELDFGEMAAGAPLMMARGMYDDGRMLRDVLPADLMADVERRVEALRLPLQSVEAMKPWMVGLTLSSMVLQQAGFDATSGIDMHFYQRALESDMRVIGLETMEEQIDVFDELDMAAQVAFLRQSLEELDASAEQLDEATELWRRGDGDGMAAMFLESMKGQPELMERLVFARNRNWIPEIEELLRSEEPVIVIVGMGHLIGEGSVVWLLRERGYTVERVQPAAAVGAAAAAAGTGW
jgi:uncharacterized protein